MGSNNALQNSTELFALADMAREEDHPAANRAANMIESIARHVRSSNNEMAESVARAMAHAFNVTVTFRGFDETYIRMISDLVFK